MLPRLLALLWVIAVSAPAWAEEIQAHHSRVELLSQQTALLLGQENLLGVHFSLEKDWHIYWINPGDSGQPPVFQWHLPDGFTAGPVEWPRPEKLWNSHLADYGYKDDVLLLVPVHAPMSYNGSLDIKINLEAKWLICREVCIPDHAQLHLSLSLAGKPAPDQRNAKLFTEAKNALPRPWPRSWKATAVAEKDSFVLSVRAGRTISSAEFFPLDANQIENSAPQAVKGTPRGAIITLKKSEQLLKPVAALRGVLALGDGTSYRIEAPVTQP